MNAEPSVLPLTGQQRPHDGTVEDLAGIGNVLVKQTRRASRRTAGSV